MVRKMNKKIENLKDLEYYSDLQYLSSTVLDAIKNKPSEQLSKMAETINNIHLYVVDMRLEKTMYNQSMFDSRNEKNRAIARARKAEEKIKELEVKLKKFNIFKQI